MNVLTLTAVVLLIQVQAALRTELKRVYKPGVSQKECQDICKRQEVPQCNSSKLFKNVCILETWNTPFKAKQLKKLCWHNGKVCPKGFKYRFQNGTLSASGIDGSCYKFVRPKIEWKPAAEICRKYESSLVSIESKEEQMHIELILKLWNPENSVWTSGYDMHNNGIWRWTGSSYPMAFENWAPGQPDIPFFGHQCLQIWAHNRCKWDNYRCDLKNSALCEAGVIV